MSYAWDTLLLDGRPLPGIVPADGEWTLYLPDEPAAPLESRRIVVWHEELHRRLHSGLEAIATAPQLECWRHRDPGAARPTPAH